jgi:hypothetical protein
MKAPTILVSCSLLIAATAALADTNTRALNDAKHLNPPRVYTGNHPPQGTKPSSYAPRPVPKNRAYGAPIQSPIFTSQPPKKPTTPASSTPPK